MSTLSPHWTTDPCWNRVASSSKFYRNTTRKLKPPDERRVTVCCKEKQFAPSESAVCVSPDQTSFTDPLRVAGLSKAPINSKSSSLIFLLNLRPAQASHRRSSPSPGTRSALKKVSTFFLYRSANMMYKSTVILFLALITRPSLAVRSAEAPGADLSPTKRTLPSINHTIKSIRCGKPFHVAANNFSGTL